MKQTIAKALADLTLVVIIPKLTQSGGRSWLFQRGNSSLRLFLIPSLPLGENFFNLAHPIPCVVPFWLTRLVWRPMCSNWKTMDNSWFLDWNIAAISGVAPKFLHGEQIPYRQGSLIHFLQIRMEHGTIADDFLIWDLTDHIDDIHTGPPIPCQSRNSSCHRSDDEAPRFPSWGLVAFYWSYAGSIGLMLHPIPKQSH